MINFVKILTILSLILVGSCKANVVTPYEKIIQTYGQKVLVENRLPKGEQLSYWGIDFNTVFYKTIDGHGKTKAPYWTNGDFNNDQHYDWVYILFSKGGDANIFAFISNEKSKYKIINLGKATKNMGVSTEKIECENVVFDVLKAFEFEGHGGVYIWKSSLGEFKLYSSIPDNGLCELIYKK